jgi:hypothetical protein
VVERRQTLASWPARVSAAASFGPRACRMLTDFGVENVQSKAATRTRP